VPFVPLAQKGQSFGEKKTGMFGQMSTPESGTRAAIEHSSVVIEEIDQSKTDLGDGDSKTRVAHVLLGSQSDVRDGDAVGTSRKARRRGRRGRNIDETKIEEETISSDALTACIDHYAATTTPDPVRERTIDDANLPTSYLWLDQPPSMGDFRQRR
jgi:hypothetical protein